MMGIRISDLSFAHGGRPVLAGLRLAMRAGERLAVLGPSGSGKTTLLRLIAGLERPAMGRIELGGVTVSTPSVVTPPHARGVSMAFQFPALWPHMTVLANATFGVAGVGKAEARERAEALLAEVGLAGFGGRYPHQLSGGEAKRVALVRALASQRAILLLDEPLVHVEPALRDALLGVIRAQVATTGATLLYVTHDAAEAASVVERCAWLVDGQLVDDAPGALPRPG